MPEADEFYREAEDGLRSIDGERTRALRLMGFMVALAEATVADDSEADVCGGDAPVQE